MPEQTKAANGKTMIQRTELATIRTGSTNIVLATLSTFSLRVVLICYAMQKQLVCRPWEGIVGSARWLTFC